MIDSERVEKAAKAMYESCYHAIDFSCLDDEARRTFRTYARAALTADAQPVGDAPRYQPIDAPITGVAAPEPLVYKDADAPHSYSSSETLCFSRECWNGKHNECKTVGCACAHHLNSSMTIDLPSAPLHSWEQIDTACTETATRYMPLRDVNRFVDDIRARLTARERVTVEYNRLAFAESGGWTVKLDGQNYDDEPTKEDAERYANGLRQELAQQKAAKEQK